MANFKHKDADKALMSDDDLALMQKYTEAYNNAADDAERNAAHDAAEQLRAKYGYAGGTDGSGYIEVSRPKSTAPSYVSKYQTQIDTIKNALMNRVPFSYSAESDPLYLSLREQYTKNGQRAMQDTLGQISARTGGIASSYAGSASQQAYDRYMSELDDKIPELQQLAYSQYMNDGSQLTDRMNMLLGLEQNDYNRYRAGIEDQRYADELAYARQRDAIADARYADELAYERELAAQKLAQQGSRSGGGTKEYKPDITYAQVVSAIKRANEGGMPLTAKEKEAYEYWMGETWNGAEESGAGIDEVAADIEAYKKEGVTNRSQLSAVINAAYRDGSITLEEKKVLEDKYLH